MVRLSEWEARLAECQRVALDTNAVIYFLDGTEPYFPLVEVVFSMAEKGNLGLLVAAIVETELLVGPLRSGNAAAVGQIRLLLDHFPGLTVTSIDRTVAQTAAELRARHGLATPDALIAAVAQVDGCNALVGNDRDCAQRLTAPDYLYLRDFIVS